MSFRLIIIAFLFSFSSLTYGQTKPEKFFKDANAFFQANVENGKVDYEAIKQDRAPLGLLMRQLAEADLKAMDANTRKAFLINAYNLVVITNIMDNYPIASPMDVVGFFDRLKHDIGGNMWTADQIENQELRPQYGDPRFHFVLVCGAKGCPPIVNFAYTPSKLEGQLEGQTKKALNNPDFIKVDADKNTVGLSEIFKWYNDDFVKSKKPALDYVNSYRDTKIASDAKVSFYPYDWALNTKGTAKGGGGGTASDPMNAPQDDETINLQTYTPGTLLKKGQFDFTLFNTIYTENSNNWLGQEYSGYRSTFVTNWFQITYGISKSRRINVGLDINMKYNGRSSDSTAGGLSVPFEFSNTDSTRFGISSVGLKVKVSPFKDNSSFSIQSTFFIPTNDYPEGRFTGVPEETLAWLDWDRYVWWNQFYWSETVANDKVQLFVEADLIFRFHKRSYQADQLSTPLSAFVSYFPTKRTTIYAMAQHTPTFVYNTGLEGINDWPIGANYSTYGFGFKYQIADNFNIELLYTDFFRAVNGGEGETYNLGMKYLTK